MPVFGIAAPEEAELFKAAADFCRRNSLRFMELRAGMPEGVPVPEGLELLPRGSALPLPQGPAEEREAFLEGLDSRQPVLLPQGGPESLQELSFWVNYWLNRRSAAGELWEILDEDRRPTGLVQPRSRELQAGQYHLVVHVWLRNRAGEYLLTRRSPNKGYGGMWESPGGAARAGDDSISACLREIEEETGLRLDPACGRIVDSYRGDRYFCDVWLFRQDFSLDDVVLQEGETCECMYATKEQILDMCSRGSFVPFLRLDKVLSED